VIPPTPQEKAALVALPFDEEAMKARIQVKELFGEKDFTTLERAWVRPTLEINGIPAVMMEKAAKRLFLPSPAPMSRAALCQIKILTVSCNGSKSTFEPTRLQALPSPHRAGSRMAVRHPDRSSRHSVGGLSL